MEDPWDQVFPQNTNISEWGWDSIYETFPIVYIPLLPPPSPRDLWVGGGGGGVHMCANTRVFVGSINQSLPPSYCERTTMFPNEARQAIPSKGLLAPSSPSIGCSLTQIPSIWANSRQISGTYCSPPSKELLGDYFILTSINWNNAGSPSLLKSFNKNKTEYSQGIGPKVKDIGRHSLWWLTDVYPFFYANFYLSFFPSIA